MPDFGNRPNIRFSKGITTYCMMVMHFSGVNHYQAISTQIAYVTSQPFYNFGIRQCHGFTQWQTSRDLHQNVGVSLFSGGTLFLVMSWIALQLMIEDKYSRNSASRCGFKNNTEITENR